MPSLGPPRYPFTPHAKSRRRPVVRAVVYGRALAKEDPESRLPIWKHQLGPSPLPSTRHPRPSTLHPHTDLAFHLVHACPRPEQTRRLPCLCFSNSDACCALSTADWPVRTRDGPVSSCTPDCAPPPHGLASEKYSVPPEPLNHSPAAPPNCIEMALYTRQRALPMPIA